MLSVPKEETDSPLGSRVANASEAGGQGDGEAIRSQDQGGCLGRRQKVNQLLCVSPPAT